MTHDAITRVADGALRQRGVVCITGMMRVSLRRVCWSGLLASAANRLRWRALGRRWPKPTSATGPILLPRPRPSPTPSPSPSPRTPPRAPRCAPTHSGEASLFPHFIKTWLAHTHTLPVLRASVVGLGLLRCCAGGTNTVSKISLVLKRRGGVRVASEYAQMATDIYKHHEAYGHRK